MGKPFQSNHQIGTMSLSAKRCLKIDDKWVNLILSGIKTWEIKRTNTKIRERIALGNTRTMCYVGYATLSDSIEMSIAELKKYHDKHQANDFIDEYAKGKKTKRKEKRYLLGFLRMLK